MTCTNPKTLKCLSVEAYLQCVLGSSPLSTVAYVETFIGKLTSTDRDPLVKIVLTNKLDQFHQTIVEVQDHVNKQLATCSPETVMYIRLFLRTSFLRPSVCTRLVLQLVLDTEVEFQDCGGRYCPIFHQLPHKFPLVEKISFNAREFSSSEDILSDLLPVLPNLKFFHSALIKFDHMVTLSKHCHNLVQLDLFIIDYNLDTSNLCKLFFNKSLAELHLAYMKLKSVTLSFPNLKVFTLPVIIFQQFDFHKMFIHFYKNIELILAADDFEAPPECSLTWYDYVLSQTIMINPTTKLKNCELACQDLMIPNLQEVLNVWNSLEYLSLSVILQSRIQSSLQLMGEKFLIIMKKNKKIRKLALRVVCHLRDQEVELLVIPALEKYGNRIQYLKIFEKGHFLTHKSLVRIINCCPNLLCLILNNKPNSKYTKGLKLEPLNNLLIFKAVWSDWHDHSRTQVIANLICDILKVAPNIKQFSFKGDYVLLDALVRIKFGQNIETLTLNLPLIPNDSSLEVTKHILRHLSNLKNLIVLMDVAFYFSIVKNFFKEFTNINLFCKYDTRVDVACDLEC